MSATSGTGLPSTSARTALAQSSLYTETRTMSAPAIASARIWESVASTSAVSVLVIDCTETGAPPPMATWPAFTCLVSFAIVCVPPSNYRTKICMMSLYVSATISAISRMKPAP